MKQKTFTKKMPLALAVIIFLMLSACFQFDWVIQPNSAQLNSSFDVEVSVTTDDGNGNSFIPYFGILLPEGWTVDDSIDFIYDTIPGILVYNDSLSLEMDTIDQAPDGYYWWVSRATDPVVYNYGDTYLCTPTIHTGSEAGSYFLDYMAGSNCEDYYGGLGWARSNNHLITVELPNNLVVTNTNDSGPGSLRHAIDSVDFYGTITFDLEEGDTISLEYELYIEKDISILGPGNYTLVISGNYNNRIFQIGYDRSPAISNLQIVKGSASSGGGIFCRNGSTPTFEDLIIKNNIANYGAGIYLDGATPIIQNTLITNNTANAYAGGIYSNGADPVLSNVTICNNFAEHGGGIYSDWSSNIQFDSIDRSNIYLNFAQMGYDLYTENYMDVVLDTFSVLVPTELHAFPLSQYSFDILHGKIEQVDGDLYVSPDGDNDNSGLTPDDPLKTIWFAYMKILPNNPNNNTIHLLAGTYSPSSNGEILPVYPRNSINLSGVAAEEVIIDAEGLSNVIYLDDNNNYSTIENMTITGGMSNNGGGIVIYYSDVHLKNLIITGNHSPNRGGGIYISNYESPIMENISIMNNTAANMGGGIYFDYNCHPKLKNVSIYNNFAEVGGGIYNEYGQPDFDTVQRCNVFLNTANHGNDIYSDNVLHLNVDTFTVLVPHEYHIEPADNFQLDIWHGKLDQADADLFVSADGDNSNSGLTPDDPLKNIRFAISKLMIGPLHPNDIFLLEGTYGPSSNGEIFPLDMIDYMSLYGFSETGVILDGEDLSSVIEFDNDNNTILSNMTIQNGNGSSNGGGIYCIDSDPVIENVTLTNNTASDGGALYLDSSSPELKNITITNNSATDDGGGIYCGYGSYPFFSNVKLTNNTASDRGGGLYHDYQAGIIFDNLNRCNIYMNDAETGHDLYSGKEIEIVVDTFTVLYPKNYHAYPLYDYTFDILNGLIPQENIDLYVSPDGDNNNTGLTPEDPLQTIGFTCECISNDSLNLYTINLMSGVYGPSCNEECFPIQLGDYVHLKGTWQGYVVLDAEGLSNVIDIQNVVQTKISNLIITNGVINGNGGGVSVENSSCTITDVIINNNQADDGGGIFSYDANLILQNVDMMNNSADYAGGAIYCSDNSHLSMQNMNISNNTSNYQGGGIHCTGSSPWIESVNIFDNTAENGGGIYCAYSSQPQLKNVLISGNLATSNGGGFYCSSESIPFLEKVKITYNHAENQGGGIFANYSACPIFDSINRSDIYMNSAETGNDLFSDVLMQVAVDTFTVICPKSFHAYPLENFEFDIWHGLIPQVSADLFVSPDGDNSNSGLTPDDPLKNITHAVNVIVEDSVNLYTIHLLEGTYSTTSNEETFPLRIPEYVNLSGVAEADVILDAKDNSRVLEFYNSGDIFVSNLTVKNGYSIDNGGGIYMINSSPELNNLTVKYNESAGYGGGIFCKNSKPMLNGITLAYNEADFGGGFCSSNDSKPTILNSVIHDNTTENSGGGIYNRINCQLKLKNVEISDNIAGTHGGGIYCGNNSDLYTDSVQIINNQAEKQGGGLFTSSSELYLNYTDIISNTALTKGGGIYANSSHTKMQNVMINGNFAELGGGMYHSINSHEFKNIVVSNNLASDRGGGFYSTGATSYYYNATITGNSANQGGGIFCQNTDITLVNSILWNEGIEEIYFREIYGASTATVSWSDVQGGEDGIVTNNNGTVSWLTGNINSYPLFTSGGEHPYAIDAGSPCIDSGNPDTTGLNLPVWDIIGNYRIWDGDGDGIAVVDMGAYEFDAIAVGETEIPVRSSKFEVRSYPNPFTNEAVITYYLPNASQVNLSIYALSGQLINVLADSFQQKGEHQEIFPAIGLPEGIYFLRLKTNYGTQTTKLIKL
jgi:predicted outer membrane repeat protein